MGKIIVTGATGYIGSHTLVDLIENGYEPLSIDNESRSNVKVLAGVEEITGKRVEHHRADLCDDVVCDNIFAEAGPIDGIIHFAAYKTVPESVAEPLKYYRNNLVSLINLLDLTERYKIPAFIFSSSCSVYGNVASLPVNEQTPLSPAASPYANTKRIGEEILRDHAAVSQARYIALRYFNPVGAHPSGLIGESPAGIPENLMPIIVETAAGIRSGMKIFGGQFDTRDGTCIRDYVHVSDIAAAHTMALRYLIENKAAPSYDVMNLGTGDGVSVKEMIETFESVNGVKVPWQWADPRPGDVVAVYSDIAKMSAILGWKPRYDLRDMCTSAWNWHLKSKQ